MKALSIQQPWAWAILHGHKHYENRTWATEYRGSLVIHAGKSDQLLKRSAGGRGQAPRINVVDYLESLGLHCPADELHRGMALGIVQLARCLKPAFIPVGTPFVEGPWCFELREPRIFTKPFHYPGKLGLFEIPDDLLDKAL